MAKGVDLVKVRRSRALRGLLALVVMMALALSTVAPAYAGTLTSATFTASTPYTYTSAQNARYDYGFTTAATSTLSKVTMSAPPGTGGSNRYLDVNGVSGNYASTPDSFVNQLGANLDLRVNLRMSSWTPAANDFVLGKWSNGGGGLHSYGLSVNSSGKLGGWFSSNCTTSTYPISSVITGFGANTTNWIRMTMVASTGVVTFYTSGDGLNWTQLGTTASLGASYAMCTTSAIPVTVGSAISTTESALQVFYADVRSTITGPATSASVCSASGLAACFNPVDATAAQAASGSWTSSSPQTETWSVNRSGTNLPADIASDLNVSGVTGLPTGGAANYRFIDGVATYNFTPTSVPASTPCTVSLQGFTNTSTAGSYSSTITTYDNSGPPPTPVDSVTTGVLVFTADSANTTDSVTIDPSMTFTVAGQGSVCNGQSASNFQAGSTATAVSLGHLSPSTVGGGAQSLSVADNAGGGFTVYLRTSGTTPNSMRDTNSHSIADLSGTNASPGSAPVAGTAGFGYTSGDVSTAFTSNSWAKMTNSNDSVLIGSAGTYSKSACIGYEVAVAPTTPASTYSTTVVYTAVPVF